MRIIYVADTSKPGKNADRFWNRIALKFLYNLADGIYVPGKKAMEYFGTYVVDNKIRMGCYTDSVKRLKKRAEQYKRQELRKKYAINENSYVFLFVGKLIETRKIENILRLAGKIENKNIHFLIVGDGFQQELVEKYVMEHDNLTYIRSLKREELEKVYVMSDAYLYLGWEPYSLALYEAAIFAKPIIANREIGACYDCLKHNVNGYAVTNETDEELIAIIEKAAKGVYQRGADSMADYIENEKGVDWACSELVSLMESLE